MRRAKKASRLRRGKETASSLELGKNARSYCVQRRKSGVLDFQPLPVWDQRRVFSQFDSNGPVVGHRENMYRTCSG